MLVAQHGSALLQEPDLVACCCQPGTSRAPLAQHLTITQVLLPDSEELPLHVKNDSISAGVLHVAPNMLMPNSSSLPFLLFTTSYAALRHVKLTQMPLLEASKVCLF